MAKSRAEITQDSDAKRGVVAKTYKMPKPLVDQITALASQLNMSQAQVIQAAIDALQRQQLESNHDDSK